MASSDKESRAGTVAGTVTSVDEVIVVGVTDDKQSKGGSGFLTGLLLGGALGALATLLYAPQGGDQTRGLIKQKTDEYSDLAKNKANNLTETAKAKAADLADKAGGTADGAKAKAAELADSVKARATDVTDTVKAKSSEVVGTVKGKATDAADTVKSTAGDLGAKANDKTVSAKENAYGLVDQGRALVEDQQSRIAEAVAAGRQAAHDKKEELTASVEADGDMDKETGGMSGDNASKTSASI